MSPLQIKTKDNSFRTFAVSANSAVKSLVIVFVVKNKPQGTQRSQRVIGNSFVLKAATESFAISARSAVNKIKPRRTLRSQRDFLMGQDER